MRCSLECHAGCECRPNQPIKALVNSDKPVTMEAMLENLTEDEIQSVQDFYTKLLAERSKNGSQR